MIYIFFCFFGDATVKPWNTDMLRDTEEKQAPVTGGPERNRRMSGETDDLQGNRETDPERSNDRFIRGEAPPERTSQQFCK